MARVMQFGLAIVLHPDHRGTSPRWPGWKPAAITPIQARLGLLITPMVGDTLRVWMRAASSPGSADDPRTRAADARTQQTFAGGSCQVDVAEGRKYDRMCRNSPTGVKRAFTLARTSSTGPIRSFARFDKDELAGELDVNARTLDRWESGPIPNAGMVLHALRSVMSAEQRVTPLQEPQFTFADLFAGIGGTRLGFEAVGGRCVFTSEYDKYCLQTYRANFRPDHPIAGDIRKVDRASIPNHDVLVAGFPCQPFSIAGVSKKNALGHRHGFECKTQGTLFFDICRIIDSKQPLAFMLENVRNLKSHDGGRTFAVIEESLGELGYQVKHRVIDARAWVPQHRERIFIVGFRNTTAFDPDQIKIPNGRAPTLDSVLHPEDGSEQPEGNYTHGTRATVNLKYTLTSHLWRYLQDYAKKHREAGNGFGFSRVNRTDIARTLSARYFKDGSEILVSRGLRKNPRRLTPRYG